MTVPSDLLGHVPATAAYSLLAAAVLAESVLLVGALVPTLGLLLAAGALARTGALSLPPGGGRAVFLARFLPVVRTLTPHLAGATRLPYRRIAPYSAVAALLWAGAEAGIGYAALATVG